MFCRVITLAIGAFVLIPDASAQQQPPRDQIGTVLGEPVYRDQIRTEGNVEVDEELHRLFHLPLLKQYRDEHQQLTPTEAEIEHARKHFDEGHRQRIADEKADLEAELQSVSESLQDEVITTDERAELTRRKRFLEIRLNPPGRRFAVFMLTHWKLERHLYDENGKGRILWQQAGVEAFDARHNWLNAQEQAGRFEITDADLRKQFYHYWNRSHGPFLTDDKERLEEFVHPEWVKPDDQKT